MNKTQEREYKKFFKRTPFNFCDRLCERCDLAGTCRISLDELEFKLRCQKEGKDPDDLKVAFEEVGRTMARTMEMVMKKAEEMGIDFDDISDEEYEKNRPHPEKIMLYKKSNRVTKLIPKIIEDLYNDLENTKPWFLASLKAEFEDLRWYCWPIFIKTVRALSSKHGEKNREYEFYPPDSMISACLALYSFKTCQGALESILNLVKDVDKKYVVRIDKTLKLMEEVGIGIKKTFPKVEDFRDKIVFHGRFN